MVIESSVTGGSTFTENGIEIWYYETPDVISLNTNGAPINQQKSILVQTDFKWKSNDFDKLKKYGNFSCRFSSRDGKRVAYTKARMEVYPYGNPDDQALPTHYRCQNPSWTVPEEARLDVSVNG